MIRKLLAAAALAAACLATPALAADPPVTSLPLTTPSGTVYPEATFYDGSHYWLEHLTGGWTGSAWKPWTMDANGYGGVNVFSSALPSGAATSAAQSTGNGTLASILSALGTPLQAGGNVNVLSFPSSLSHVDANGVLSVTVTNPSSGGGTASTVSVSNFPATQPISASALPLPSGAATASGVAAVVSALGSPLQSGGSVAVASSALPAGAATSAGVAQDAANNAPFNGEVPLTVGTADSAPRRSLKATCTSAGNVTVTYADGSTGAWAAVVGIQTYPLAITTVNTSGTTATCTYANLK